MGLESSPHQRQFNKKTSEEINPNHLSQLNIPSHQINFAPNETTNNIVNAGTENKTSYHLPVVNTIKPKGMANYNSMIAFPKEEQ